MRYVGSGGNCLKHFGLVLEFQPGKRKHPIRVKRPGFNERRPVTVKISDGRVKPYIFREIEESFGTGNGQGLTAKAIRRCLRSGAR